MPLQWPEIANHLQKGQNSSDRPDIVSRVFHIKLREFLQDMRLVFGEPVYYVSVVEWQTRGLPHAHILWKMQDRPQTGAQWDRLVSAQCPPDKSSRLYELVKAKMMHDHTKGKKCYDDDHELTHKCGFPRPRLQRTMENESGQWMLRCDTHCKEHGCPETHCLDCHDSMVVSYNAYLLLKYEAHVNVKIVHSWGCIKYLFQYLHKGADRVHVMKLNSDQEDDVNEIEEYVAARYRSSSEVCWKLFEFKVLLPKLPESPRVRCTGARTKAQRDETHCPHAWQ